MRFLPFILVLIGAFTIYNYISAGNRAADITNLIENGETAMAILDDEYSVTSKKSETFYETKYTFKVDDQSYTGERKTYSEPTEQIVEVRYLKEDPSVNGYDLEKELSGLDGHEHDSMNLYLGIAALIVGLVWLFFRFGGSKKEESTTA